MQAQKKSKGIMKLKFTFITFLLIFQSNYSQIENEVKKTNTTDSIKKVSLDPLYFVLGTLSDYMGRFEYVEREKQIDRYYPYEMPVVDFLTKYIKTELNIDVDTTFEKSNHSKMYSDKFSKTLNSFYGVNDKLLNEMFETINQKYSFLAGVYYRYGDKLDTSIYKIQLANSPKHQNCYEFLKQVGCENIFYQYLRNIPAQFILYFEPTDELKKYLEYIESERIILEKSYHNQIYDMMEGSISRKKLNKDIRKTKSKEVNKIRIIFKR
jgi:hypothetical protein